MLCHQFLAAKVGKFSGMSKERAEKNGSVRTKCAIISFQGEEKGENHTGRMPEICDCMQIRISKTMLTMLILKLSVEEIYFYS